MPWAIFIAPERRDPKLSEKLNAEASGILNRMLDGICAYLDYGLKIPCSIEAATADYRSDSDPLGRFLDSCTRQAIGKRVQSSDMYNLFAAWAKSNGEAVWSAKGFGAALIERGMARKKSVNVFWLDVELTKSLADFVEAHGQPDYDEAAYAPGNF